MNSARIREIVRQFPENGLKLLLHHPANVRDLLRIAGSDLADELDFERLTVDPTSYVASDYRHVESDLVLTVPFRRTGRRSRTRVTLYILIEHQSEPDRLMLLRLLDYMVQIWKSQVRAWGQKHPSLAAVRLQPILPIVFYTGTRPWDTLGILTDLIEHGEAVRQVTPSLEPLFLNLGLLPPDALEQPNNYFGWVLRMVQGRREGSEAFRTLLRHGVVQLEAMPDADRLRWLELLSYIHALVYHDREPQERAELQEMIRDSVLSDPHRQEVSDMRRTIADELRDEGRVEGLKEGALNSKRETLLRQMRRKFKRIPKGTERIVSTTDDIAQLDEWLDRIVTAENLAEVGIVAEI